MAIPQGEEFSSFWPQIRFQHAEIYLVLNVETNWLWLESFSRYQNVDLNVFENIECKNLVFLRLSVVLDDLDSSGGPVGKIAT